jgi:hypothetical protein
MRVEFGAQDCRGCGVVFTKYRARTERAPARISTPVSTPWQPAAARGVDWWLQLALLIALAGWTVTFATTSLSPALMDTLWHLPDLVFHEAGHVLFLPFGQLMTALGGSLLQCGLPLGLAGAFLRQGNHFGAVVCVWWAGQNLVDVAPYIADARTLQLTLIGGRTGGEVEGHDWEYILTQLGWLHLDQTLGRWVYRAGLVAMMAALATGLLMMLEQPRPASRQVINGQNSQFKTRR